MKILVVRFSSIGDIILTTPIVRCLEEQLNAEIHFLTKKAFVPLLKGNPHIEKIISIEKSLKEKSDELKSENYDVVIDLHNNIRTLRLKLALGKKSFSFPKKNAKKWLLTRFKWNFLPQIHVVDRYFSAVDELGVRNDRLPCELYLDEQDSVNLSSFGLKENEFVAVAMGAQFLTKQLPVSLLAEILSTLDSTIVLLGGKMDCERAKALKIALKQKKITDFCGKLSLRSSAYILRHARVLLTGDTGLMHIASTFGVPIVSVWGNTVPAFGMYPYFPQNTGGFTIHEVENLQCRPCSKIGYSACPKGHFNCMNEQNTAEIQQAVAHFWNKRKRLPE